MPSKTKVLIVDDDADMLENYDRMLGRLGYQCITLQDPSTVDDVVHRHQPDVVLSDLKMPQKDGIQIIRQLHQSHPEVPVILITAYGTIPSAVQAMQEGAFDYLAKPFSSEELKNVLQRVATHRKPHDQGETFEGIVARSPLMMEVFETIKKIAPANADVLIYGESGTGKELIARSIHARSARGDRPFVPVDCASIPEHLLESELFGHDRGAFTGAYATKPGIFEFAHPGTLFLDEVGRLGLDLQAKLLRALQERKIRRVGGRELIPIDVRIISATNTDLREAISKKEFREDLYYRLNVVYISLPPLRSRVEDIPLLATHYLHHFNESTGRNIQGISEDALQLLMDYAWPGNVRELMNAIERAVLLAEGDVLTRRDLSAELCCEPPGLFRPDLPYKQAKQIWLEAFERRYMEALLKRFPGNISRAAQEAGIARKTIHRFLNRRRS